MRILIATGLYPPDIGGPATYSALLERGLPKRGVAVRVWSFGSVRHLPKILRHAAYLWGVLTRGWSADVLYAQDPVSVGLPVAIASIILRKRFVLKFVGDYAWELLMQKRQQQGAAFITPDEFQGGRYDMFTELRRRIERWVAHEADSVVVPSQYLRRIVLKWGIEPERVKVIYNSFKPPYGVPSREDVRKELGMPGGIIVSVGRLVPWKGFGALINSMPRFDDDVALYIIGDGPGRQKLKKQINEHGLEERVILLGDIPHDEVLLMLRSADVFVLNTGYEGFSHVLLEAMALGTPIVTTDVGGNPELITDGENGELVRYGDSNELVSVIQDMLHNSGWREAYARNSQKKVKKFSCDVMIQKTLEALI